MGENDRLREKNLVALGRLVSPDMEAMLRAFKPAGRLVFDDDGVPDLVVGRTPVYGGNATEVARKQVDAFLAEPDRLVFDRFEPGPYDEFTNRFLRTLLERAGDAGIEFRHQIEGPETHYLLCFGIGLGAHVARLVEATGAEALILFDDNPECLYHSLGVFDWAALIEPLQARGGGVNFVINPDGDSLAAVAGDIVRNVNPWAIDGTSLFVHNDSPALGRAYERFKQDRDLMLFGLGFFTDETIMARNAHANLKSGTARTYLRPERGRIDAPAFVVASGPSLDSCIGVIRENADNAIIITSGTAIRSLVVNGITPDFHVELENMGVFPILSQVAEHDLSSVHLVASTTVDPHILDFFDQRVLFFRENTAFDLFGDSAEQLFLYPGPTVANGSLCFAQECRFRDIYFFGVDMGVKNLDHHHSRDTYHFTEDAIADDRVQADGVFPVAGNFGGQVLTWRDFHIALGYLVRTIKGGGGGLNHFNCSDGVAIDGTRPTNPESVRLETLDGGKEALVRWIVEGFPVYGPERFERAWRPAETMAACERLVGELLEIVGDADDFRDRRYLGQVKELFERFPFDAHFAERSHEHAARRLFRGTVSMTLIGMEYYLRRLADEAHRPALAAIINDAIRDSIDGMLERLEAVIDDPQPLPPLTDQWSGDGRDPIAEVYYTWGEVRRNEPCPCGSGKKYKHCHGQAA